MNSTSLSAIFAASWLTFFCSACADPIPDSAESTESADAALFSGGEVRLHASTSFGGRFAAIPVASDTLVGQAELGEVGMQNDASSLALFGLPREASVYLYDGDPASGRFIEVTGNPRNVVRVADLQGMRDRASLLYVADHGQASIRIGIDELQSKLDDIDLPAVHSNLRWGRRSVILRPDGDTLVFRLRGTVSLPFPLRDKRITIDVFGRPELDEHGMLHLRYAGFAKDVDRCGLTVGICRRIRGRIDANFADPDAVERMYFGAINGELALLSSLAMTACGGRLGFVRYNNLPDAAEIVATESAADAGCLAASAPSLPPSLRALVSLERPAALVRFGEVRD